MPTFFRAVYTLVAAMLILAFPGTALAATFAPPLKISGDLIEGHNPAIAVAGDNLVHVVWAATLYDGSGSETDREIYYVRSTDNGVTFSAPVNISNSPGVTSLEPSISVASDKSNQVHVAWHEFGSQVDIMYARSVDDGLNWSAVTNVSNSAASSFAANIYVEEDLGGNRLHVAWTECPSNCEIYYAKSNDAGSSFETPKNISNQTRFDTNPVVVANTSAIHIAWQGSSRIYYSRSADGGATFSPAQRMTTSTDVEIEPTAVIDGGGRVHVAWETRYASGGDIFWRRSLNAGASFELVANRSADPATISSGPTLSAPKGGQVSLAWSEESFSGGTQFNQNFSVESKNGGSRWNRPDPIGGPARNAREPALVHVGNRFYIVWEQTNPTETGTDIYFAKGDS
ncbi:MAG: sialidase family protein [Candidatus Saccharimonadales bacterium]